MPPPDGSSTGNAMKSTCAMQSSKYARRLHAITSWCSTKGHKGQPLSTVVCTLHNHLESSAADSSMDEFVLMVESNILTTKLPQHSTPKITDHLHMIPSALHPHNFYYPTRFPTSRETPGTHAIFVSPVLRYTYMLCRLGRSPPDTMSRKCGRYFNGYLRNFHMLKIIIL